MTVFGVNYPCFRGPWSRPPSQSPMLRDRLSSQVTPPPATRYPQKDHLVVRSCVQLSARRPQPPEARGMTEEEFLADDSGGSRRAAHHADERYQNAYADARCVETDAPKGWARCRWTGFDDETRAALDDFRFSDSSRPRSMADFTRETSWSPFHRVRASAATCFSGERSRRCFEAMSFTPRPNPRRRSGGLPEYRGA